MKENGKAARRVGVVGLGSMGGGIALNLIHSGYEVIGFDASPANLDAFVGGGGHARDSAEDVAADCEITVLMVRDSPQALEASFGRRGWAAGASNGDVLVVCSSLGSRTVREIEARSSTAGLGVVDAPVSGGQERARSGQLTLMVSGTVWAVSRATPILDAMSDKVFSLGEVAGEAQVAKSVNQALYYGGMVLAAEGLILGAKAGLSPKVLADVVQESTGDSWVLRNRITHVLNGEYEAGGSLSNATKDLGIIDELAADVGLPNFATTVCSRMFRLATGAFGPDKDTLWMVKAMEESLGISLQEAMPAGVDDDHRSKDLVESEESSG